MYDFRECYDRMSDDELLHLASQPETLVPEAQAMLQLELQKRNLTQLDLFQYRDETVRDQTERERLKLRVSVWPFHGLGRMFYGRRDFGADGSYLATQWFVVSWIPLIPLASARVKRTGSAPSSLIGNWNDTHEIVSWRKPDLRQVFCVYIYFAALFLFPFLLLLHPTRAIIAIGLWLALPAVLRQYARARVADSRNSTSQMGHPPMAPT